MGFFRDFLKNGDFWSKFNITDGVPCKISFLKIYTFMYFNEFVKKLCPLQN